MQIYLKIIRKIKEKKMSEDILRIEEDLLMTDYHINNCFMKEKEAQKFIDKIHQEYKEELEYLDEIITINDYSLNKSTYYLLFDIGYKLFRIAIIKTFENEQETINKLICNTDQVLCSEIIDLLNQK